MPARVVALLVAVLALAGCGRDEASRCRPQGAVSSREVPGPDDPGVVPRVVGRPVEPARATLRRRGFAPEVRLRASSARVGRVIAQRPRAGTRKRTLTRVRIDVSDGPLSPCR